MILDGVQSAQYDIDSFLMMGQSNMAGRGAIGEVAPILDDRCFMLRNGRWQKMSEPINPDRAIFGGEFSSGISPAASFATHYAETTRRAVGLIPCADGGTQLSQWMPGEVLFDHAVLQAQLAMRSSVLKGVLWHQGESDCSDDKDIAAYYERFCHMAIQLRLQLKNPDLPIIIGEIAGDISDRWAMNDRNKTLNSILSHLAQDVPNVRLASAAGLTLKADGIHFDAASCRTLGNRYFFVYRESFL